MSERNDDDVLLRRIESLGAQAAKAEAERAEEWRRRREAESSRDVARAVADSLQRERDQLRDAAAQLIAVFDEQSQVAQRIIAGGRSDKELREAGIAAIIDLRAAVAKAEGRP